MRADVLANALGARRIGGGWIARCPAHDDREPSLAVREGEDGRVLVRCHAGCDQWRVIEVLRSRGLWEGNGRQIERSARGTAGGSQADRDKTNRPLALEIWNSAIPADETLVEIYLRSRGLVLPPLQRLRLRARLKHPSGGIWPAMVGLVTRGNDDTPIRIHRTYLARNGGGKAPVHPQKMMLGLCRGGAVRLALPAKELMVGEGIETCLAAMLAVDKPAWAALSTAGLRALDLPLAVRNVIILADGDEAGEAAADDAALRWMREGRGVSVARPPRGLDFNDMLLGDRSRDLQKDAT
jgi:putative DNA primase/helicase